MERISFTLDPRDMLITLQTGFIFVRPAVAWAILERPSGFEPSSETTAPRYLKLVAVSSFRPSTYYPFGCHQRCVSSVWSAKH